MNFTLTAAAEDKCWRGDIRMNGDVSLNETHERATDIEHKLKERFGLQRHVTIHIKPV